MTFEVKFPNLKLLIDYTAIDDLKLLGKETFEMVNETSLAENTRKFLPDGPPPAGG